MATHILCVSHDRHMLEVLTICLTQAGYQVTTLGKEAGIREVSQHHPDRIIISLSPKHAFQLARLLSADPQTSAIPRLMLTGFPDEHTRAHARAAGFDRVLIAPYTIDDFLTCLRHW